MDGQLRQPSNENCRPQQNTVGGLGQTNDPCCEAPQATPPIGNDKKMREFTVKPLSYGYIVVVGCTSFAIETKEQLINKLTDYIKYPEDTEKKWFAGELF